MRKNDILYLALVLLLTVGCVKDNSSEIHVVLNDVCIEGIEERYENVYVDHPLCITPQVSTLRGTDFSHLDFYWITYNKSNYTQVDTLAHTKDLNIVV